MLVANYQSTDNEFHGRLHVHQVPAEFEPCLAQQQLPSGQHTMHHHARSCGGLQEVNLRTLEQLPDVCRY